MEEEKKQFSLYLFSGVSIIFFVLIYAASFVILTLSEIENQVSYKGYLYFLGIVLIIFITLITVLITIHGVSNSNWKSLRDKLLDEQYKNKRLEKDTEYKVNIFKANYNSEIICVLKKLKDSLNNTDIQKTIEDFITDFYSKYNN